MSGLPVHASKIQRPALRDVLSRPRLNRWLDEQARCQLVLVIAEAGYGKTTLLADWARETSRRVLWYRLDSDDRDWLAFIRHLVVAARQLDDEFGPETIRLIGELGPGGPTRDDVVARFLNELGGFAAGGLSVILDDFHRVEGSDEIPALIRALLDRADEGLSIVIASRRPPRLAVARLRARGRLAELSDRDLRFDDGETDRLFRDAYGQPLEPDVVADLSRRTDGWAASLGLVNTAIKDRSPAEIRSFVAHLSGARGDLHDFLAEEVLGNLSSKLQRFLMRTSILDVVDPVAAAVADPQAAGMVPQLVAQADELRLLTRTGDDDPEYHFHPLVRDFLQARLESDIGADAVRELHLELGRSFEGRDWRISATHYSRAGDHTSTERVIEAAVDGIFAAGQFEEAASFLELLSTDPMTPVALILRSRFEVSHGAFGEAVEFAEEAVARCRTEEHPRLGLALLNLAALQATGGMRRDVLDLVTSALEAKLTEPQRQVAEAYVWSWRSSRDGNLRDVARHLRALADRQTAHGLVRYAAITRLNLSSTLYWLGDIETSLRESKRAEDAFMKAGGSEHAAAAAVRMRALAHLGRDGQVEETLASLAGTSNPLARYELSIEGAQTLAWYGDGDRARWLLAAAGPPDAGAEAFRGYWLLTAAEVALRNGDLRTAAAHTTRLDMDDLSADTCALLRRRVVQARIALREGASDRELRLAAAASLASAQGSQIAQQVVNLLLGASAGCRSFNAAIRALADPSAISIAAEEVASRLACLGAAAFAVVQGEATRRPERWQQCMREAASTNGEQAERAAHLLSAIGSPADIELLRRLGRKSSSIRTAGDALARRHAKRVKIDDLGAVRIRVGEHDVPRATVRRKVLALLTYLLARREWVATKEEVLEALWPELGPETATNSLNQTIYFLRRVFEPGYREETSPAYVRFDGETVGLDPELIEATSDTCRKLTARYRRHGSNEDLDLLAELYAAKFSVDFSYEDWAASYRESLHAAVLEAMEQGINRALDHGDLRRAIHIAQRVLAVDPEADEVELKLISLYRRSGAYAAAAEQYTHYSSFVRDELGGTPPPLESL